MTKRFKKIVYTSFLLVFLLGYIGTIVPGSVIASLFDLEVRALDDNPEEPEKTVLTSVELVNESLTREINSNEMVPVDWLDNSILDDDIIMGNSVYWLDENDNEIWDDTNLSSSHFLYGHFELSLQEP